MNTFTTKYVHSTYTTIQPTYFCKGNLLQKHMNLSYVKTDPSEDRKLVESEVINSNWVS